MTNKIVKSVEIGPFTYKIKKKSGIRETPDGEELIGFYNSNEQEISIDKALSGALEQDTLVHEILHGIYYHSGLGRLFTGDDDNEEAIINTMSPWILMLIQDNPKLMEFLTTNDE